MIYLARMRRGFCISRLCVWWNPAFRFGWIQPHHWRYGVKVGYLRFVWRSKFCQSASVEMAKKIKEWRMKTNCENCCREIDLEESQTCEVCGLDGLGNCCIGVFDHDCENANIEEPSP